MRNALLLNLSGMGLGLAFALLMLQVGSSQAHSSEKVQESSNQRQSTQAVDERNNDYKFPSQKDFKGHHILNKRNKMQSFDVKAVKIKSVIDKEIVELEKEKRRQEREVEAAYAHSQKELHQRFLENLKARKELMKDIQEDLEELEELEITDEEAALQRWD